MPYRVTSQTTLALNMQALQRQQKSLQELQQQISSGQKIQKPSDDPLLLRSLLIKQDEQARLKSHVRSVEQARLQLEQANTDLRNAHQLFVKAQQLALQGVQATEQSDRAALAGEVDGLLNQLYRLTNNSSSEGTLFGGAALNRTPFVPDSFGTYQYVGGTEATRIIFGDATGQTTLDPGNELFTPASRGPTQIEGTTGAVAGTGTDTATGLRSLLVEHTGTTILGASGVVSGASSAQDTLLGNHALTITDTSGTGAFGTISLAGSSVVSFTSSDTNLRLVGPGGEVVHLDLSNVTAGFSGTVTVQGAGRASIDGGLTFAPIGFSANEVLTDSRDQSTVNVDSSGIRRAGIDRVELTQTANAFEALKLLRDDLLTGGDVSSNVHAERINRRLTDVVRIQDHLLEHVGTQSVRLENLDLLQSYFEDAASEAEIQLTESGAADIPSAVLKLQETQLFYQYTLSSFARLYESSFLNFLQ